MTQALRVILMNALKFIPRGGEVTVSVQQISDEIMENKQESRTDDQGRKHKYRQRQPFIRIDVTDTGAGISHVCKILYYYIFILL